AFSGTLEMRRSGKLQHCASHGSGRYNVAKKNKQADSNNSESQRDEAQVPASADASVLASGIVPGGFDAASAKVRTFPQTPGVYFMKDRGGRVIYVGKAKNLRARAGSYFLKAAADERRTAELVREIHDIDFLEAESEVDALLIEARLVKDIQPKFNQELKDDK